MASQATIDKAAAFRSKAKAAQSKLDALNAISTPSDAQKREMRSLKNQISSIQHEFATDPDLIGLAGENMDPADKLFLMGLSAGTTPGGSSAAEALIKIAAANKSAAAILSKPKSEQALAEPVKSKPVVTGSRVVNKLDMSKIMPNVLHEYASYTYGLSLHLLTAKEYNKLSGEGEYIPNRVLIASAGRYNNTPGPQQFVRSPYFKEDFYFDNLELETVIGLNAQSRNTNAVQYKFTLIEPYGFTLLDRIIDISNDPEVGSSNYLDMPYLLQIDFFGINDAGIITGVIPNTTKRIPIRILKMDAKITGKGAEYSIQGVPYNHSAFDLSTLTTPTNLEIKAGSVAEFFQSSTPPVGADTTSQRDNSTNKMWVTNSGKLVNTEGQFTDVGKINTSLMGAQTREALGLTTSYGTALNKWQEAAFNANKIGVKDTYVFNFVDKEIAEAKFTVSKESSSPFQTGMAEVSDTGTIKPAYYKSKLGLNMQTYDPTKRLFQVNAGTYVDRVISWVIRNSTFVTEQVKGRIPDELTVEQLRDLKQKEDNEPLLWFKITPSIRLLEFDNVRNVWAREITYNIQKYEVRNVKVDVAPQGTAKTPVKAYNYIYTGKNTDILDLDIQFNASYYTALTTYRNAMAAGLDNPNLQKQNSNPQNYKDGAVNRGDPNAIMPLVMKPVVSNTRDITGSGSATPRQIAVADLEASLMILSQADMLNVKLKIIGDPSLVKQDDIFWSPKPAGQNTENKTNANPLLTFDGSLKMDNGEVYVSLVFKTPMDIDVTKGVMDLDSNTTTSLFSGLYKIMTVTNEFRNGQFTQTLNLLRLVRQDKLDHSDNRDTLPGKQAILDNYMLAPNFSTSDKPKAITSSDETPQRVTPNETVIDTGRLNASEARALAEVKENAPTNPITPATEPATVPPLLNGVQ